MEVKEAVKLEISRLHSEYRALLRDSASRELSSVKLGQLFGGMRGVLALVCETSTVDPQAGLIVRGRNIRELADLSVEEMLWLLLTGNLPTQEESASLEAELRRRAILPAYVETLWSSLPVGSHPMVCLSAAVSAMQRESSFARLPASTSPEQSWQAALDDALTLIACLPLLAAGVYRHCYNKVEATADASGSWPLRLARGLDSRGMDSAELAEFADLLRLLTVVQSDHEGANACALTAFVVASADADPYRTVSSGLNALAGPIHGLASQVCFELVQHIRQRYGGQTTPQQMEEFCWERLQSGRVIPGFGHAVLRGEDPRYALVCDFGRRHFPDDELFGICELLGRVAPQVLIAQGKASSPWPNIDGISGSVLQHYGIDETQFFTVLFGISLSIGVLAQYVLNCGVGCPVWQPDSASRAELWKMLGRN